MTLPLWPAELPQKMREEGFRRGYPDLVHASRMASGVHKTRALASMGEQPVQCMIRVDRGGLARFDRFFFEETRNGNLPFLIRDQVYDGVELAAPDGSALMVDDDSALAISAVWLVRFTPGSPPEQAQPSGVFFRVPFFLTILP
ncbi:hypothetical protein [Hansschlegelia zhihuaiae]|uniref:Uncharacterized protein n=1 Tax=Hansschlegelia zhihuaiae TaxID=405005 RepID=A0A4Q0MFP7_9HYPH|nr:hypothetical protein [Hansschlegelia zhihuaiae]RXF72124.1 hypothetical protein EK403_15050 [Hansschlegelia zhihuaiae]